MYYIRLQDGRYYSREDSWDNKIFLVHDIGLAKPFRTKWLAERKKRHLLNNYDITETLFIEQN